MPDPDEEQLETVEGGESPETEMPDPAFLLSYAAMHLPTMELMKTILAVADGHAWRNLGMVAGLEGVKTDLPSAQLAIDLFGFLFTKLESEIEEEERREMQRRLNDLRTNFLEKSRE
ncbi:MAG: DUF1844 domain-containing protein [Chthonomonadaceae bacterium]|nr:DUF1844 domain-containing protein [Chthonomonadaceae bacterium]